MVAQTPVNAFGSTFPVIQVELMFPLPYGRIMRQGRAPWVRRECGYNAHPGLTPCLTHYDAVDTHDTAVDMGDGITQQRIAHEFGHALNMTMIYPMGKRVGNTGQPRQDFHYAFR